MSGVPLWPKGVQVRVCRSCRQVADTKFCGDCGSPTALTNIYNKDPVAFEPEPGTRRDVQHGLTESEADVMVLLAEGYTNSGIAERLNVTEQTIKYYLAAIYPRIGVRNRVQAVQWWRQVTGEVK